jgi:hypothetical protein
VAALLALLLLLLLFLLLLCCSVATLLLTSLCCFCATHREGSAAVSCSLFLFSAVALPMLLTPSRGPLRLFLASSFFLQWRLPQVAAFCDY